MNDQLKLISDTIDKLVLNQTGIMLNQTIIIEKIKSMEQQSQAIDKVAELHTAMGFISNDTRDLFS